MKAMVLFVLVIAAGGATLALNPSMRREVEKVLFAERPATAPADAAEAAGDGRTDAASPGDPGLFAQVADQVTGAVDKAAEGVGAAVEQVAEALPELKPAAQQPAPSAQPAQPKAEPEPAARALPAPRAAVRPAQRVVLPPGLNGVQFGMTSERVSRAYKVAWTRQERGERMLVHYPRPDKSQTLRFHFAGDSLYRIEVRLEPAEGQTRKQLYDQRRQRYAEFYANVPERSETQWSDGTVSAHIQLYREGVELIFTCKAARR